MHKKMEEVIDCQIRLLSALQRELMGAITTLIWIKSKGERTLPGAEDGPDLTKEGIGSRSGHPRDQASGRGDAPLD